MFHIFTSKRFLIDFLEGFIDIHNHILPGIDDGAKTVRDSIELIKGFSEFGVDRFIVTPHIMHDYYPNTPEIISNSMGKLKDELLKNNLKHISIEVAAEHMIDSNFEFILEEGKVMPMHKNYLLIEMSYLQPSINFDTALQKIAKNSYYTILAHPERYMYLHDRFSKYIEYKQKGISLQLNLLSLGDYYGKEVQRTAFKLIQNRLIDFVASDIHNISQLNSLKELTISKKTAEKLIPIINNTIATFY